jgi:hypothetical protein
VIRFDFVSCWGIADTIERVLFDVFVTWYVVPAREFVLLLCRVVVSGWDPEASEDSLLVSVDVTSAGDGTFRCVLEVALCLVLLLTFFFIEGFVAEGCSDFLSDGVKHEISSVMIIEMSVRITMIMSSMSLRCVFVVIDDTLPLLLV